MDTVQHAVIGIGSIGFLPITVTAIRAILAARRERRRRAMLARHAERMAQYRIERMRR